MRDDTTTLREFATLLAQSRRIAVFTGAGISTESGIPDFRSQGGVWSRYRPIDFSEFLSSEAARRESWRRQFETDAEIGQPEPNRGPRAIEMLVRERRCHAGINQKVDGQLGRAHVRTPVTHA